jgi:hypothetical protein
MPKRRLRRILAACAVLAGASIFSAAPAAAAPSLPGAPKLPGLAAFRSCAAIHNKVPLAQDGNYVLFTHRTLLGVYCHDMAGTPKEYINLTNTVGDVNFSQYTAGGASPGTNVRTSFSKLRIYPATLTVDINDLTFAASTGQLMHSHDQSVTSMPYGSAMSCDASPDGIGNIDLRGTAFTIADTFAVGGYGATGGATLSAGNQVADLAGGGFCGWITPAPALYNPFNPQGSDYRLELTCAPFHPGGILRGQICVKFN